MGWLWKTPEQAPPAEKTTTKSAFESEPEPVSHDPSPKPLSRDEVADKELQSFFQELEADTAPSSTKYNRVPKQPPTPDYSSGDAPLSEQLLPRTMSCRDAFDAAFYCNSMGGQFNNLYRYGTVRDCKENWNDFWFCMRTRTLGREMKEEAIRGRYREKERMKYGREGKDDLEKENTGRSSEDIWKSRDKKMEWGKPFSTPFPPPFEGTTEEWNAFERERRRNIVNGTMGS